MTGTTYLNEQCEKLAHHLYDYYVDNLEALMLQGLTQEAYNNLVAQL